MGLNTNIKIDKNNIKCGEEFLVTLALNASPDIKKEPIDIILALDTSASMQGTPLEELKKATKQFVKIIQTSTNINNKDTIEGGSKIGIISFATEVTKDINLTTNVLDLYSAIDNIKAEGFTNHASAFEKATEVLLNSHNNKKVIVMFTDGITTIGKEPSIFANIAKERGITIYSIGLIGQTGIDTNALNSFAINQGNSHIIVTDDYTKLKDIFKDLAKSISKALATNISIDEVLEKDFTIVEIAEISKGITEFINGDNIKWHIDELGIKENDTAILKFRVKYTGKGGALQNIYKAITYTDNEGNIANFEYPAIKTCHKDDNNIDYYPTPCQRPVEIDAKKCQNFIDYNAGDISLDLTGRILNINLQILNVCPNKKVALAVMLTEKDCNNKEIEKGIKIIKIPAHNKKECININVKDIKFILPDEKDALCDNRKFKLRFIAHYIDFGICNDICNGICKK